MVQTVSSASRTVLITGAGGGIGRALAIALASDDADVVIAGRTRATLLETAAAVVERGGRAHVAVCDLDDDGAVGDLAQFTEAIGVGRLAVLVHSAALHLLASIEETSTADFDRIMRVNVRGPFMLTRLAIPLLRTVPGDVVFINSSAALSAPAATAAYAASKAALRAFADSLRAQINADGVRVLTVFPGRTATAMQEAMFQHEGRQYRPELLLQPSDVATAVTSALGLPRTAELTELHIRPAIKSY